MLRAATAACLALPLIAAAAAAAGGEQVYYKITLQDGRLSIAPAPAAAGRNDGRLQQIELQSFQWAVPDVQGSGGGANQMVMNDTPGAEAKETMPKNLEAENKMGDYQRSGHSMLGASDKVTVGGSQTESAQATGKRQHMPIRMRMYYDTPQGTGPGILSVKASLPGCTVGRRYGGMQFAGGGKTYRLRDVRVESCGGGTSAAPTERITFVYGTLDIK